MSDEKKLTQRERLDVVAEIQRQRFQAIAQRNAGSVAITQSTPALANLDWRRRDDVQPGTAAHIGPVVDANRFGHN
jgi:hypothetical protein